MHGLSFSLSTILAITVGITSQLSSAAPIDDNSVKAPLVVFVVRHAEKEKTGRDPVLSEAGQDRAKALAGTLRDAKIQHVHSTGYQRTLMTAAKTAKNLGLDIQKYDPSKLTGFAETLRRSGGRHLVVGHSNTTPALVKLLGGDPVSLIDDATEYDRLYVLTIDESGECSSVLMRYGKGSSVEPATTPDSK